MLNNLKLIINRNRIILIFIVLTGSIVAAALEIIGIGSIPIFAMMIMDPSVIQDKFSNKINLQFLENLKPKDILILGGATLTSIFIIKNTYLALLIYFQGLLIKKIRSNLSEKVFRLYLCPLI